MPFYKEDKVQLPGTDVQIPLPELHSVAGSWFYVGMVILLVIVVALVMRWVAPVRVNSESHITSGISQKTYATKE